MRWDLAAGSVCAVALMVSGVSRSVASDVATCPDAQVRLSLAARLSAETGEIVRAFNLRNHGSTLCALRGYPGVELLSSSGRRLPFTYRRGGRYFGTRGRPKTVVLAPGDKAWFVVAKYRCDGQTLRIARSLAAIPPDGTHQQIVRFGLYPIFGYCKAFQGPNRRDPGDTVYVGPVHAS